MIHVNMISQGQEVKGQGVGSAYFDLVTLLQTHAANEISLSFNDAKGCDLKTMCILFIPCVICA